jgi:hypothetical protein
MGPVIQRGDRVECGRCGGQLGTYFTRHPREGGDPEKLAKLEKWKKKLAKNYLTSKQSRQRLGRLFLTMNI